MIKNRNRLEVLPILFLLLIYSCKEETSLALNPQNGITYDVKTFTLSPDDSETFRLESSGK